MGLTLGLVLGSWIVAIVCAHRINRRFSEFTLKLNEFIQATHATQKRIQALDISFKRFEELFEIEKQIKEKRRKLEQPSVELQEFLADVADTGCGILRIQPDSIFIRGLKR